MVGGQEESMQKLMVQVQLTNKVPPQCTSIGCNTSGDEAQGRKLYQGPAA